MKQQLTYGCILESEEAWLHSTSARKRQEIECKTYVSINYSKTELSFSQIVIFILNTYILVFMIYY